MKKNCVIYRRKFILEGFNTIVAYNGRDVLKQIDDKIDLIILDIKMPYIDGFEVAQSLKESNIPIIFLTAKDNLDTRLKCFSLGAKDYLPKPFYMEELIIRIKMHSIKVILKVCLPT